MICFIRKEDFSLLSTLVVHYKILHSLKPSSTYEYTENQCNQMFSNLNSFKKHYSRKHAIENLENTVPKKLKLKQIDESHVEINDTTEISNQININNAPV